MRVLSFVEHLARAAGDADLAAALEDFVADPRRLARLRVDMGDIGDVDRQFLVDDAAGVAHARLGMAAGDVNALHDQPRLRREDAQHLARTALVAAADDDDVVALLDLHLVWHGSAFGLRPSRPHAGETPAFQRRHHSTSGASETIFMKRRARSSRVTGPKMRVPIGSPCRLISTAALRSKRIALPSVRRISLAVRTMTARCTSPFLTRPRGIASLTETMMTSPTVAVLRFEPPSTLMHWTRRAPELSATSRLVCIWIMRRLRWARPSR